MRLLFVHEVDWRHKVEYEIHDFPELLSLRGHEVVFVDYPESRAPQGVRSSLDLKTESSRGLSRCHAGLRSRFELPAAFCRNPSTGWRLQSPGYRPSGRRSPASDVTR